MPLLPKQNFQYWYIFCSIAFDTTIEKAHHVWSHNFIAGSQSKYMSDNPMETVTMYIPAIDDFAKIPQLHILFTVNIHPKK